MQLTKNFTSRRKSGFRIAGHKYGLGSFVFLNFASLVNMDVCQKTKRGNVPSAIYIICDPLYENRTNEAIPNFVNGAKINFVSNMAFRLTVSIKPFVFKRCFLVCQQNSVFELYYGYGTDLKNVVAFPLATVKFQAVKCGSSIENLTISFNFVQV